jgi:hypothetical protein
MIQKSQFCHSYGQNKQVDVIANELSQTY